MTVLLTGIQLFFAAMFTWTAMTKLLDVSRFELVLVRLFGTKPFARVPSRPAALAVAGFEFALAAALGFGLFEPVSTAVLVATTVTFTAVVWRAWRQHVACGCFPDRRPAEVSSMTRSVILVGLATTLLVFGIPPVAGGRLLASALCAVGIGAGVYLVFKVTARIVRGAHPEPPKAQMVPAPIAAQILAQSGRGMPDLPDDRGWFEVTALCRAARLPVSALLIELERRSMAASAPLLPPGTAIEGITGNSIRDEPVGAGELPAASALVALFSATCTRCPTHVPDVVEHLRRAGLPRANVLVAVSGDGPGAQRFVTAFDELAVVVVEPVPGPIAEAFSIREFPAFYRLDDQHVVTAGSTLIGDLDPVLA
jgi:uncharacterized membrane protein YphA (DoxX/SURF4 family)